MDDGIALDESRRGRDATDSPDGCERSFYELSFELRAAPFCIRKESASIATDIAPETDFVDGAEEKSFVGVFLDELSGGEAELLESWHEFGGKRIQAVGYAPMT